MNQTARTVANVASQVVALERTPQSAECRSAAFQRHFINAARNPFFGWNPEPQTILNFQISGWYSTGNSVACLMLMVLSLEQEYLLPDDFIMSLRIDPDRLIPAQYAGTIIIGCNLAHGNYFHWCSQALPAIDNAVRRIGQDQRVTLALPQLNAWQEESLQLLGHGALRR